MIWLAAGAVYVGLCLLYAASVARRAGSLQKGALYLVFSLALPGAGPLLLWFCDRRMGRGGPYAQKLPAPGRVKFYTPVRSKSGVHSALAEAASWQ